MITGFFYGVPSQGSITGFTRFTEMSVAAPPYLIEAPR